MTTILTSIAALIFVSLPAETVSFEQTRKVGEKDSFTIAMNLEASIGTIDFAGVIDQEIKKSYENGDSDLSTIIRDIKVDFSGQKHDAPPQPATVTRVDTVGAPVGERSASAGRGMSLDFLGLIMMLPLGSFELGKESPFERSDLSAGKRKLKGTVLVENAGDGKYQVSLKFDVTGEGISEPMKIATKSLADKKTRKLQSAEGTISKLPSSPTSGGIEINAVQFKISRVKAGD